MPTAFALFQGLMPLIGYYIGSTFADSIKSFSGYITATIFFILGAKIIFELIKEKNSKMDISEFSGKLKSLEEENTLLEEEKKLLEEQKMQFMHAKDVLSKKYPGAKIEVTIGDDYRNMKEIIDKDPRALNHAKEVFHKLGIEPKHLPVRGGTDGATFSFKGCPTPNLGTGSYNHHGRFEFLSVRDFNKMIEIVKELVKA